MSTNDVGNSFKNRSAVRVAIIGAGPAGLAAAQQLARAGVAVDIYESSNQVGGFCQTLSLWGHKVDLGPHRFFSSHARVVQFWHSILGEDAIWLARKTRIFYRGRFFEYPLQWWSTFWGLGPWESFLCFLSFLKIKIQKTSQESQTHFEGWVQARFGKRLYEIFFKSYTEKLWGLPCTQIDSDFAQRKIRRLHFWQLLKKMWKLEKTYVDYFSYPRQGTGSFYQKIQSQIHQHTGHFYFLESVGQLDFKAPYNILVTTAKRSEVYTHVVSTMPLTQLVQATDASPEVVRQAHSLRFRSTILVYVLIEGVDHFPDNWVYIHSKNVDCGRVTNFRNWSPELTGDNNQTVLCLEYWCSEGDSHWQKKSEKWQVTAVEELAQMALIKNLKVIDSKVIRLPKTYPVFHQGYKEALSKILDSFKNWQGLYVIGRNGSFRYNNQDHSLLMGLQAADSILLETQPSEPLWQESYEEDTPLPITVSDIDEF